MLPLADIGRLEHHFVLGNLKMAVQEGDTEPVEVPVLGQHEADFLQTGGVAVVDRPDSVDIFKAAPLKGAQND